VFTVGTRAAHGVAAFSFVGFFVKSRKKEEAPLGGQFSRHQDDQRQVRAFVPFVLWNG
jgi:hypothetical protein